MTMLQNVGVLLCGLIFEIIVYAITLGFYDSDKDELVIDSIIINMFVFLAILLAWANGSEISVKVR